MGSYVSVPICKSQYNVTIDCNLTTYNSSSSSNGTLVFKSIGGAEKGHVEPDPDIAGIGILGVFVGVTAFAMLISIADVLRQIQKTFKWKRMSPKEYKRTLTDIFEALLQSCSDQQIFTGAAYALTLRYWRGCSITAYHYNIVANLMLLTCATHLMSVTIIRNYWKFPLLALARVLCVSGVFVLTGVLMSNQNAQSSAPFPTGVPSEDTIENGSAMYLAAACFQSEDSHLTDIFRDSTSSPDKFFNGALWQSTPRNYIQGWRWYLVTLLFYGAAIIAEFIRFCRRGQKRPGWRKNLADKLGPYIHTGTHRRLLIKWIFLIYLIGGIGISCATVVFSTQYIYGLRSYVDRSGWLEVESNNGQNPENDATSFGQLVPIFLSALVFFTFLQTISEKWTDHKNRKHGDEEIADQTGNIHFLDPSHYDLINQMPTETKPTATYGVSTVSSGPGKTKPKPTGPPMKLHNTVSSANVTAPGLQKPVGEPLMSHSSVPATSPEAQSLLETNPHASNHEELYIADQEASGPRTESRNATHGSDHDYEVGLAAALAFSPFSPTPSHGGATP
ncbi:hypothetical protein PFICI_08413 [Pestalotiopsis fici W106-1]|uniref:Uncharacterized protein n=1 Tax=Pestalotiopsis fici (strain W106-1 / CGMCC3.15140) TaxID=1229662 RepID=W3X4E6_PESFW|nr:uncharacterized protein PFICI_08413 [Pestalotiopsis fici W106-1]ETS80884.1 hypothetical protein PFICI_08413 [Pestalotiopsis fici W106-1]